MNITGNRKADGDDVHYPKSAADVLQLLWTLDYDVAHLHVGGEISRRVLALMLACTAVPRKRAVFTLHSGGFPSSPKGRAATPRGLLARTLRRFDAVVGVNPELVDMFLRLRVAPDRAHLVYPFAFGPRTTAIAAQPLSALPDPLRRFFRAHSPVLLSVGLLEAEYDLPLQIAALGDIRKRYPSAGLVMIGSGSLEARLRALVAEAPWRDHLLLTGDVHRDDVLLAIARCDVLLRTTLYDGDAISVREALHLGTPVIASDNGMRPTGTRLLPRNQPDELVSVVARTLAETFGLPKHPREGGEENIAAIARIYDAVIGGARAFSRHG